MSENWEISPFRQISPSFVTPTKNPPFPSCPLVSTLIADHILKKKISLMTLLNKLGSVCIKFVLVFGNFITVFIQITSLSVPILPKMSPLICFVPTRTGCGESPLPLIPLGKSCQKQCVWCHKQDPRVMSQYIAPRFLLSTGTDNCQQDY